MIEEEDIEKLEQVPTPKKEYSDLEKAEIISKSLKQKYQLDFDDFYVVPEINLTVKKVEPGTFQMGSEKSIANKRTLHTVHLTQPYWLGIYPITQKEYKNVMQVNPSHFLEDNSPVEKVSWNQANKFCQRLTEREREAGRLPEPYVYRLPIEAEWEYACRANNSEDFFIDIEEYIWYYKNSNERTHEVGLKKPNSWGFFDMQGNVFEWCLDSCDFRYPEWYELGNTLTPLDRDGVINPCWRQGSNRIAKGGSWLFDQNLATPSARYINPPDSRYFVIGFRVALGLPV